MRLTGTVLKPERLEVMTLSCNVLTILQIHADLPVELRPSKAVATGHTWYRGGESTSIEYPGSAGPVITSVPGRYLIQLVH